MNDRKIFPPSRDSSGRTSFHEKYRNSVIVEGDFQNDVLFSTEKLTFHSTTHEIVEK